MEHIHSHIGQITKKYEKTPFCGILQRSGHSILKSNLPDPHRLSHG